MKKILTIIMTLILSTIFSQNQDNKYPRFEIDSNGQKVVVMTIPQAMKLNTNSNVLNKYEILSVEMQDYENICIKVVNEKDEVISKLEVTITKLDEQVIIKDSKIETLQSEIKDWMKKNNILEEQIKNRQDLSDQKDKQIIRLKTKMVVGGIGSGLVIIALVLNIIGIY